MTPPTQDDLAAGRERLVTMGAMLKDEQIAALVDREVLLRRLSEAVRFHWMAWTEQGTACQFCQRSTGGSPTDFDHDSECVVLLV